MESTAVVQSEAKHLQKSTRCYRLTIRSFETEKYYIGSTNQKILSHRLSKHKSNYKCWLKDNKHKYMISYESLKYDDCYIELLELCACNLKAELHKREGKLIRIHKDSLVNKFIPCRTMKEYRIENKEIIALKMKAYHIDNSDKIKTQHKQYYIDNVDKIKQYYIDNVDKIWLS